MIIKISILEKIKTIIKESKYVKMSWLAIIYCTIGVKGNEINRKSLRFIVSFFLLYMNSFSLLNHILNKNKQKNIKLINKIYGLNFKIFSKDKPKLGRILKLTKI